MKKILLLSLVCLMLLITGCTKEDKTVKCTLEKDKKTTIITIERKKELITIQTNESELKCIDKFCSHVGNSKTEDSDEDLDKLVEKYKKEGYSCE